MTSSVVSELLMAGAFYVKIQSHEDIYCRLTS